MVTFFKIQEENLGVMKDSKLTHRFSDFEIVLVQKEMFIGHLDMWTWSSGRGLV